MSKNTIIAIVIGGIAVLLLIFILVLPTPDVDELPTDNAVQGESTEPENLAIMELTEEEMLRLQAVLEESIPMDTPMEDLEKLDAALMQLTAEELRTLTVEIVQEMLAEIQA